MSAFAPFCSTGELPTDYDAGYDMGRRNMVKAIAELYKEEMKRQVILSKLPHCGTLRVSAGFLPSVQLAYLPVIERAF